MRNGQTDSNQNTKCEQKFQKKKIHITHSVKLVWITGLSIWVGLSQKGIVIVIIVIAKNKHNKVEATINWHINKQFGVGILIRYKFL